MVLLPLGEIVARRFTQTGIPGSGPIVQHLTLWVGFLGAALAATERRHLALATQTMLPPAAARWAEQAAAAVGACIAAILARAAADMVWIERQSGTTFGPGIPTWIAQLVLPLGFAAVAFRSVTTTGSGWSARVIPALGLIAGVAIGQFAPQLGGQPLWPLVVLVIVGTLLGAPLFALLGGVAALLFIQSGVPIAAMPVETYRLAVSPTLAAVPLFTLAGFLLSESQASRRLVRVFRALLGWLPGGTAIVCAVVCAFFTAFTGGSGVTILALGALLFQALRHESYREPFSLGLLTACGSLGLLFPPALPLILYGIVAQIPIEDLFVGGILPGFLLLGLVTGWGIREGLRNAAPRQRLDWTEVREALREGVWELALPVVALVAVFGGFATLVEASALTVLYTFVVQCFVFKDLSLRRDLPKVLHQSAVLIGGVLIILGVAMGLSSYMVDADVPGRLVEWTRAHIHSQWTFLLMLNLFLLVVGCLMDIFSALVVVVPLIVPLGMAFGVHPVHLGIIFVANLELGYLTPPVGLNLFLASYRFGRPLHEIVRATWPMMVILAIGVLLITYLPWLTTGLLGLVRHP